MFESILELMKANPRITLILVGILVTLASTLVTKYFTDQEHLKHLKKRQKELQEEIKKHKADPHMMEKINAEMLEITSTMMKSNFKPMFITFIPFLLLFYWLSSNFAPLIPGKWLFPVWVWYYLLSSIIAGIVFRKVFNMA